MKVRLPVAGQGGNVIGVITDRDISFALGTRDSRASEICGRSVMSSSLLKPTKLVYAENRKL